jgi:hypothetical protein
VGRGGAGAGAAAWLATLKGRDVCLRERAVESFARPGGGCRRSLAGWLEPRDQAKLLEHAECVYLVPELDTLSSDNAADGDSRDADLLACWGDARRHHDISSVGFLECVAHYYLLAFSDNVVDCQTHVGEGVAGLDEILFVLVVGVSIEALGSKLDQVASEELVNDG